ncbi:MAG: HAD-IC family P-type ATPase [Anaerolineales bacterium]|nr:HAD-IC family P-type ATPase [Anaerolineales bacterium]
MSLGTDETQGLSQAEAEARLAANGPNELVEGNQRKPWQLLWEQLTAVMVLILIGAAVLSLLLGKTLEAGAIGAIVVLFAALVSCRSTGPKRQLPPSRNWPCPQCVLRAARCRKSRRELVVGDVVVLEAGNVVPADVRILTSANLRIQEAALTGESEPVEKSAAALSLVDAPLAERRNMGYMGTQVTYGRGTVAVVATGMDTELGRIADLLQTVDAEMTPLQRKLDRVGKMLAIAGVVIAGIMLAIGLAAGESLGDMLLTAIGVAVAVIPEGLPAVVTFTLAVGAQHMLKRNALIRKLPAVETLGSVTVICSDKTGTLTQNRMTVTVIDADGDRITLTEHLRHRNPEFRDSERLAEGVTGQPPVVQLLLAASALCNDAQLSPTGAGGDFHTIGDPTEGALLVAAAQGGQDLEQLRRELPRRNELPFDSDRKRMTTLHALPSGEAQGVWSALRTAMPGHYIAITKGAVDGLLAIATHIWEQGAPQPLTPARRQRIEEVNNQLARGGMRVLGIALRVVDEPAVEGVEAQLTFLGLVGMIDPPRPEVRVAVETCRTAGIRPVMITGDHPLTAITIAHELGIASNDRVLTGADLSAMEDDELERVVADVSVFAASPLSTSCELWVRSSGAATLWR